MKPGILRGSVVATAIVFGSSGLAQDESTNRVAAETDWSVFVESDPTSCWSVSSPSETVNTKDGRRVAVKRGDILLFVSYIPSKDAIGQVSFTGGYSFAGDSLVSLKVGEQTFQMVTREFFKESSAYAGLSDEMAFAPNETDDAKIVAALKRGIEAVLVGRSSRGTTTTDTFSLLGFTAALEEAASRCSG